MLRTTYNLFFKCDRCGYRNSYTHFLPDFRPHGWREVTGREPGRDITPRHFCPKCAKELFGHKGLAYDKPETSTDWTKLADCGEVRIVDDDGRTITYKRDSEERSYFHKVDDDDDMSIGLTD